MTQQPSLIVMADCGRRLQWLVATADGGDGAPRADCDHATPPAMRRCTPRRRTCDETARTRHGPATHVRRWATTPQATARRGAAARAAGTRVERTPSPQRRHLTRVGAARTTGWVSDAMSGDACQRLGGARKPVGRPERGPVRGGGGVSLRRWDMGGQSRLWER